MKNFSIGYFSHSMRIFDTQEEQEIYNHISSNFNGHLICPNKHFGRNKTTEYYHNTVGVADVLFVYELNGYITEGIFREIRTATEAGKPIIVCRKTNDQISFYKLIDAKLNPNRGNQKELGILEVGEKISTTRSKLFDCPF